MGKKLLKRSLLPFLSRPPELYAGALFCTDCNRTGGVTVRIEVHAESTSCFRTIIT